MAEGCPPHSEGPQAPPPAREVCAGLLGPNVEYSGLRRSGQALSSPKAVLFGNFKAPNNAKTRHQTDLESLGSDVSALNKFCCHIVSLWGYLCVGHLCMHHRARTHQAVIDVGVTSGGFWQAATESG